MRGYTRIRLRVCRCRCRCRIPLGISTAYFLKSNWLHILEDLKAMTLRFMPLLFSCVEYIICILISRDSVHLCSVFSLSCAGETFLGNFGADKPARGRPERRQIAGQQRSRQLATRSWWHIRLRKALYRYLYQPIRRQVARLLMPESTNECCTLQYMQRAGLSGGSATALRTQSCMFYSIRQCGMRPAAPDSSVPHELLGNTKS
jgi:hypothetical protein